MKCKKISPREIINKRFEKKLKHLSRLDRTGATDIHLFNDYQCPAIIYHIPKKSKYLSACIHNYYSFTAYSLKSKKDRHAYTTTLLYRNLDKKTFFIPGKIKKIIQRLDQSRACRLPKCHTLHTTARRILDIFHQRHIITVTGSQDDHIYTF